VSRHHGALARYGVETKVKRTLFHILFRVPHLTFLAEYLALKPSDLPPQINDFAILFGGQIAQLRGAYASATSGFWGVEMADEL
jgi:hypothetical protein